MISTARYRVVFDDNRRGSVSPLHKGSKCHQFPGHNHAEGAFLANTNSIDPTRPMHVHKYKVRPGPRIRLTDSVLTKQKCSSCGKKRMWQKFKDGREGVFANQ